MTTLDLRNRLRTLLDGVRRLPETLFPSAPLVTPPCNWRDYDVPTFKRRGIRLSIGEHAAYR